MCKGNESISFTFLPSGANEVHFRNSCSNSSVKACTSHFHTVFSVQKKGQQGWRIFSHFESLYNWRIQWLVDTLGLQKNFPPCEAFSSVSSRHFLLYIWILLHKLFFLSTGKKNLPPSSSFPSRCNFRWERFWKASLVNFMWIFIFQQNEPLKNDEGWKKWHFLIQLRPFFNEFRSWKEVAGGDRMHPCCATSKMQFLLSPLVAFCSS